jgi:hypothetical protein
MTPEELAARVTLVDQFATTMSMPLTQEQVIEWVEILKDIPLGWLSVGTKRCAAHFDKDRRPRPGDIRRAAREVAGPGWVSTGGPGPGFEGHHSNDAWPPEVRALRLLREGRAITPFPPQPTVVELPELPKQVGARGSQPERLGDLLGALLVEPGIKKVRG